MSRTIRRTTAKARYPRFIEQYIRVQPKEWHGINRGNREHGAFPWLLLEGPAYNRICWRYHSDNGLPEFAYEKGFERPIKQPEKQKRAKAKVEIQKWLKNPEHEIAFPREKQFYDWP